MKKDFKEFIPIGILDIIGIISIIQVLTTNYIFSYRQYIGLTLIFIASILFFVNRRVYKYLTGIILIIGLSNLIGFTTTTMTFGISIIQVELISLIVLLIYIYIFKGELKKFVEKTDEEKKKNTDALKDRFKRNFKNLSDFEIEKKLNQNLVPEAIQALMELKNERK